MPSFELRDHLKGVTVIDPLSARPNRRRSAADNLLDLKIFIFSATISTLNLMQRAPSKTRAAPVTLWRILITAD